MKKESALKYPNSANLFSFCRKVLDHKYGGIRVIDQDVGQILGFDPADCSHWKRGKKNIRSIQAIKSIAIHLGIDESLIVDVASGEISDIEAYYEFSGYGSFEIDGKILELAKKEYYRKHSSHWSKDKETEFRDIFFVDTSVILEKVNDIHRTINFAESPLYLPEIVSYYPDIVLKPEIIGIEDKGTKFPVRFHREQSKFIVGYEAGSELKPYVRYKIAKSLANYFLPQREPLGGDLDQYLKHLSDVEGNIFACSLLTPVALVRKEAKQLDAAKDMVSQLAEAFWVSKGFLNQRLKVILQA